MGLAGGTDDADEVEGTDASSYWASVALALVVIAALVIGALVLVDGAAPLSSDDDDTAAVAPAARSTTTDVAPTSSSSSSSSSSSTSTSTSAPTPATPVTPPTVTVPTVTVPPTSGVGVDLVAGLSAELPAPPVRTSVPVSVGGVSVTRSEYTVDVPGGGVLSITTLPGGTGARSVDDYLGAVVDQVGRDLGVPVADSAPATVAGAAARPFRARTADGLVRGVVLHHRGHLVTVSMFTPGRGDTTAPDAVFDRVVASLRTA